MGWVTSFLQPEAMKRRNFKLLTKATYIYIVLSFVFFIISALVLQNEANKLVYRLLENRFQHREAWIKRKLERNPQKEIDFDHARVKYINQLPKNTSPAYTDTLMLSRQTQIGSIFRKKSGYITVKNNHYRYEFFIEVDELYKFKEDIFRIIIIIFILMALALILGNYVFSGFIFDPFKKILKQMSKYQIGKNHAQEEIKTSTREFLQLKTLFESMKRRIETDYDQLKEYTENMSHELQTPLTVIQNKIESMLIENNVTAHQAHSLKLIYDEIIILSKLGSTLNLLTKIENLEFNNIIPVKSEHVIREHIEKVEELAAMQKKTFELDLYEDHIMHIDPGLLNIMLRNLVKNALHYSKPNSTIRIRTSENRFTISNDGDELSFPPEQIFNRYKKGSDKNSLGLGLAIVKKICEINQYEINYNFSKQLHMFIIKTL
jgi:signal transduction histidine kinase